MDLFLDLVTAFHKHLDPRTPRLLDLVDKSLSEGEISGKFAQIARKIEKKLNKKNSIPMNIDGVTAVIYAELGCPAPLARGFFLYITFSRNSSSYLGTNAGQRKN